MTGARAGRPGAPAGSGSAAAAPAATVQSGRVMERGRAKAHRPLPLGVRRAAMERGLAAYGRGAWFLAHEELEPAWMGTDDPVERALLSGLIKLAAAYVHAARGNPLGVRTNLQGAGERLATAAAATAASLDAAIDWIDLPTLLVGVDDRLARIEALCARPPDAAIGEAGAAVPSHDVAGPVGRFRGAPVAIPLLPLPRRTATTSRRAGPRPDGPASGDACRPREGAARDRRTRRPRDRLARSGSSSLSVETRRIPKLAAFPSTPRLRTIGPADQAPATRGDAD